jgi:hypothetical protein
MQGEYLLSMSLNGYINYLDINNPNKPLRVVQVESMVLSVPLVHIFSDHLLNDLNVMPSWRFQGPCKALTSMSARADTNHCFVGSYDGWLSSISSLLNFVL